MSTVDNRIVNMRFNNSQFESGVAKSMSTLDRLEEKLKFKDAGKSLGGLQRLFDGVDTSGIERSIGAIERRFSLLGIAGMEVVRTLTANAISGLKTIENATIGQIKSGGWSRAMNLANAQFTVEGLKLDWNEMLKAINYGVQDTAYGLDAAATAASSLAASGVAYKESVDGANDSLMHTSLRAISGVAAMTNSSYEDISRVFTTVAGQGRVMGDQLNQLAARGLNAAATLGEALGKTEAEIRDMVSHGQIDFKTFSKAMDDAFGAHAKEANRTFQGALSNMKAALSRIGAIFATPIIGKTNIAFIALTDRIKEVQKSLSDMTETVEENGKKVEKTIPRFATHFSEAWTSAMNAAEKLIAAVDLSWFQSVASAMDLASQKATKFFNSVSTVTEKLSPKLRKHAEEITISASDAEAAFDVMFNKRYGTGKARIKALEDAGHDAEKIQKFIDDFVKAGNKVDRLTMRVADTSAEDLAKYFEELKKNGYDLTKTTIKLGESTKNLGKDGKQTAEELLELEKTERLMTTLSNLGTSASNVGSILIKLASTATGFSKMFASSISKYIDPVVSSQAILDFTERVKKIVDFIKSFSDGGSLKDIRAQMTSVSGEIKAAGTYVKELSNRYEALKEKAERIEKTKEIFDKLALAFSNLVNVGKNLARAAINVGSSIFKAFTSVFNPQKTADDIGGLTSGFENLSSGILRLSEKAAPTIEKVFTLIFSAANSVYSILMRAGAGFATFIGKFLKGKKAVSNAGKEAEKSGSFFDKFGEKLDVVSQVVSGLPDKLSELFSKLRDNKGVTRLTSSLSGLWEVLVGIVKVALKPFITVGSDISENVSKNVLSIDKLAETIGNIADKVAGFIERLTAWLYKLKDGISYVTESITSVRDKVRSTIDFDPNKESSLTENIKTFVANLAKAVSAGLREVDWKTVGGVGIVVTTIMALLKLKDLTSSLAKIPKKIGEILSSIAELFGAAKVAVKYLAVAQLIKTVAFAIIGLASAIYMLSTLPSGDLMNGISAIVYIGIVITAILKIGQKIATSDSGGIIKTVGSFIKLLATFSVIGTFAIAIGFSMFLLSKAVSQITKSTTDPTAVVQAFGIIVALIGVVMFVTQKLIKQLLIIDHKLGNLVQISAVLAAISGYVISLAASVAVLSVAFSIIRNSISGDSLGAVQALGTIVVLISAIAVATFIILKSVGQLQAKQMLAASLLMVTMGAMLTALAGSVAILSIAMKTISGVTSSDPLGALQSFGIVAAFLIAVSTVLYVLLTSLSALDLKSLGVVSATMSTLSAFVLSLAGSVFILTLAVSTIAGQASKDPVGTFMALGSIVLMLVIIGGMAKLMVDAASGIGLKQMIGVSVFMIAFAASLGIVLASISLIIAEISLVAGLGKLDAVYAALSGIVGIILSMGLSLYIISKSVSGITDLSGVAKAILAMGVAVGIIGFVISKIASVSSGSEVLKASLAMAGIMIAISLALTLIGKAIGKGQIKPKSLLAIGESIALMAASILLIAAAMAVLTSVIASNPDAFMLSALTLAVFFGAFSLIAGILSKLDIADSFLKIGEGFALAGLSALLLGLGMMAIVQALTAIVPIIPVLLVGLDMFFEVLEDHWPMALAIVIVIGLIVVAVSKLSGIIVPLLKGIVEIVSITVKSLGELLSSSASRLGSWFKGLSSKSKMLIVGLIMSLCSALTESGPEVLRTIGNLILMFLDWAAEGIPKLVDKLIVLLISLINGLADAINSHAHAISAAIFNVIASLINIVLALISDLLSWIPGASDKINGLMEQVAEDSKVRREEAEAEDAKLRAALEKDYKTGKVEYDPVSTVRDTSSNAKESGEKAGGLFSKGFDIGAGSEMGISDIVAKAKNSANLSALGNEGGKDFGLGFDIGAASNMGMSDVVAMAGGGELGDIGAMKADDFMDGYSFEMASPSNISTVEDAANEGYVEPVKSQLDELEPAATDATHRAVDGMITALWEDRKDFQGMFHNQYVTMPIKMMTGKNGWDEHSPSHVFQHIAEYAVMGLMRGFEGQSEHLGSSVSSLSDQVIKSFGDPLARIGAMANGEIEYDPSIRPVLDSSNIAAGAGDINSLFRNQNVSLSGLSGRLAADLGEVTANNADIVDELVALRSDMADMTDRMSNLQVVMNNGALVGAIAGDMDAALGQRTNFRRRGN